MDTLSRLLFELETYDLNFRTLKEAVTISTVVLNSGTSYRLTFSSALTSTVTTADFIYIEFGSNNNFYKITSVGANYVDVDNGQALESEASSAKIYSVKSGFLNKLIDRAILLAERMTNISFSGTVQKTEYYSGNGTNILILNKRPVISLDAVEFSNYPDFIASEVSSYDLDGAKGLIKHRGTYSFFPKGDKNLKITYTTGYSSLPSDVQEAVVYLAMSDVLADEAGINGGLTSMSVVAYSESYGSAGKYSPTRKRYVSRAKILLKKYKTGITG